MLSATLVQMAMALAVPWPLKSVLDNVVGNHPAPLWISWLLPVLGGDSKVHIAEAAALLTVAIAAVTGVAMYAGSYLTESLGQAIGNELRVRLYHHLQELSLAYYDTTRVGIPAEHTDRRRANHPGLRVVLDTDHPDRHPLTCRHDRGDALAALGFRAHRVGRHPATWPVSSSLCATSRR
jgi:ABC-type multidrug transport system fused ATPase/permease subunit